MVPILTFIGWHNSGKTSVIRKVAQSLRDRGYNIAIIKSTEHTGLDLDSPGSDSYLYRRDGIESVALACPDKLVLFQGNPREQLRHLAFRLFPDADLVICEGFKHVSGIPKIEVTRAAVSKEPLLGRVPDVMAVVSDYDISFDRVFKTDQVTGLTDFIETSFLKDRGDDVSLFVNGQEISLKKFVRRSLEGTVLGFIRSLHSTEGAKRVELCIELKAER